jgi:hypothetical protein
MDLSYNLYIRINGSELTLSELSSKAFHPENWIPAPLTLQPTELNTWKLTHWGCSTITNESFTQNDDGSITIECIAYEGIPVAFFSYLCSRFSESILKYRFYTLHGSIAGYGQGSEQPIFLDVTNMNLVEQSVHISDWSSINSMFYL